MPSPAHIAWQYLGMPEPIKDYASKYIVEGQCSHCGQIGNTVLAKRIVSKVFTNWDVYSNTDKPLLCNPCIWSFSEKDNRSEAIVFISDTLYTGYQLQSMKDLLKSPLSEDSFVSAAIRKNKHVLPYAQWGHVRIEDLNFKWSDRETHWLEIVERLNNLGFTLGDIKNDDSPSFSAIVQLNKEEAQEAYALWEELVPLRKLSHLFSFILELNKNSTMEYKVTHLKQ